ncbi:hypothetical protein [Pseudomonas sp.]|uniref:hypothetical protein n=1 Tax=Pseudomonas sp. TaxID=306 RepID=UPI00262F315D|nr:hypothetical protein [Pseudomonas sp.]
MSEKPVVSPFQLGVCAAIQVLATAIAAIDPTKRQMIKDAAEAVMSSMPADKGLVDGSSEHHIALQSLIVGLHLNDSPK